MAARDMIAVQSMDGQLAIYEQEHFAFNRQLPNVLLPVRCFVHWDALLDGGWCMGCVILMSTYQCLKCVHLNTSTRPYLTSILHSLSPHSTYGDCRDRCATCPAQTLLSHATRQWKLSATSKLPKFKAPLIAGWWEFAGMHWFECSVSSGLSVYLFVSLCICRDTWLEDRMSPSSPHLTGNPTLRYHALAAAASARDMKDSEEGKIGSSGVIKKIQVGRCYMSSHLTICEYLDRLIHYMFI